MSLFPSVYPPVSLSASLPLTLYILFAVSLLASASICQSGFVASPSLCSIFPRSPICYPSFRPFASSPLPHPPLCHNTNYCGLSFCQQRSGEVLPMMPLDAPPADEIHPRRDIRGEGGRSASDSRARIFKRESSPHNGMACSTHRGERQEAGNK